MAAKSIGKPPANATGNTSAKATGQPPAKALEALAIGIDIGGTGTKFGIVDRDGNVLFSNENINQKTYRSKHFY